MKHLIMTRENALASIEGRKTQTRRVLELPIPKDADEVFYFKQPNPYDEHVAPTGIWARRNKKDEEDTSGWVRFIGPSPYQEGEQRWIKESGCRYRRYGQQPGEFQIDFDDREQTWPKLNARFFPRWASRLTIEIAEMRVQRLQEISLQDAWDEGVQVSGRLDDAVQDFERLWDSINAARGYPWSSNPRVLALTYRRLA